MKVLKDLAVSGQITVGQLLQSSIDTDKFIVSDGGVAKFRTGSQLLGDIDGVINTRTITINGTAQDLTANRSWTVGDVRTDSSYANPAWITSLAWSKITGAPAFLTSYSETDPIYTSERDALLLNKMVHSTQLWSTLADFNRPSGYSTMIQPSSYQNPVGTHGYFHVIARRDTGGGYGVLLQAYNSGEIYHGNTTDSTQNISWYRIWNSSNFNPSNYLPLAGGTTTGKVTFPSAVENRPQMPGGILGLDTSDGNFDIWGISRDYYPSHATAANAWGILWNGDNNQIRFIGAGSQRLVIDLDGGSTGALTWEGNNIWHAGNLTNLNQLTNGPGYITSYTETDTLATVTGRGASTSTALSLNGGVTITGPNAWNAATPMLNIGGTGDGRMQVRHIWGKEAGTANPDHLWLQYTNSTFGVQIGASGGSNPLYVAGDIYMGGYFGGNLVATRTWVQSQGYITSGSFLPLSGGTLTGTLIITTSTDGALTLRVPSGDANQWNYINFNGTDNVRDAYFGTDGSGNPTWYRDDNNLNVVLGSTFNVNGAGLTLTTADADVRTNRGRFQVYNNAGSGNLGYRIRTDDNGGWRWQFVDGSNNEYFGVAYSTGVVTFGVSSGTIASRGGFSDFIGYNPSYGSYIGGGAANASQYIYAGGYFYDGSSVRTLWHTGNFNPGSYLPLSGGTMTGDLRFNQGSGFGRIAYADNYHGMILRGIPNNAAGDVTVTDVTSLIQHSGDFRFYRTNGSINELYFQVNASAAYWRGNTIIHSGTIGSQSVAYASNADTVDGYHMNQNVLTSSSPTFNNVTADGSVSAYGLRFRNGTAITYCGFGGGELNNIFHTESAWGNLRHNDISNYEVSADGSSWSAGTLDANIYNLFLGERDKGGSLTIAASGLGRYQRFTFAIGYKNFDMLHITGSTNGEQIYIKLETSTDGGSTYSENFTSIWSSWPGNHTKVWSIFNSAITRIRLTIYKPGNNYGNSASINSINYYGGYSGYGERYHMQVYSYDYQTANITRNTTIGGSLIVYSNQTISGSGYGLYFSGGNNRIYFGGSRAIEGNGTNLQIGEGHSQTQIQSATTQVDGNIVMAKGADPRIYSNTNVGLNIDGQALYLNRYVGSDISMVFGGGNVMIGPYSGPSFALHVKKNQNQVAGFESPNANTWIDLISTAGTWSMGATSSNTWAIYQRGGTNATRFEVGASSASLYGNTVWHAGNLTNLNQLSNGPGYITQTNALQPIYGDSGAHNLNVSGQQANIRYSTGQWVNGPTSGNYSHVLSFNLASDNRTVQMYLGDVPGYLWWRPNQGGTWHPWERILTSNNIGSFALTSLPAHNHDGSAITTGTVANARTTASSSNGTDTIVLRNASGYFDTEGVGVNKYIYLGGYRTFGLGNLGADGTQAKRYEIARLGIDYNDWNSVGSFEVELHESYYGQGLKKVYNIWYGYVSNSGLRLVEYRGNGANNFRVVIGSEVIVSGDHRYLPVYVDVSYYGACHVVIRTNRSITGNSNSAIGATYIFTSPTGVNTSNFTADSTPEITTAPSATIGGNTIWHTGNLTNLNQLSNGPGYFNTSNDGAGSGLDADLLDGRDGSGYLTHIYSGFSFPTGSYSGWYRIARSSQSSGGQGVRGGFKIIVSSTGNYLTPAQDEITGFKDWTNQMHLQSVVSCGATPFTDYRLVYDSDYTYLEGYISYYFGGDQSIAVQSFHWGLNGLTWSPHTGNAVASTTSSGATSIGKVSSGSVFNYLRTATGFYNASDSTLAGVTTQQSALRMNAGSGGSSPKLVFGTETESAQGHKSIYLENYWMYVQVHYNEGLRVRAVNGTGGSQTIATFAGASGNFTALGDVTAYSDVRYKTNINKIDGALNKVLSLNGVTYNRTDIDPSRLRIGLIAQEVQEVIPEVVNIDDNGVFSVAYGNMVGVLIEAVKEQQKQIEELKTKLNAVTK